MKEPQKHPRCPYANIFHITGSGLDRIGMLAGMQSRKFKLTVDDGEDRHAWPEAEGTPVELVIDGLRSAGDPLTDTFSVVLPPDYDFNNKRANREQCFCVAPQASREQTWLVTLTPLKE